MSQVTSKQLTAVTCVFCFRLTVEIVVIVSLAYNRTLFYIIER